MVEFKHSVAESPNMCFCETRVEFFEFFECKPMKYGKYFPGKDKRIERFFSCDCDDTCHPLTGGTWSPPLPQPASIVSHLHAVLSAQREQKRLTVRTPVGLQPQSHPPAGVPAQREEAQEASDGRLLQFVLNHAVCVTVTWERLEPTNKKRTFKLIQLRTENCVQFKPNGT